MNGRVVSKSQGYRGARASMEGGQLSRQTSPTVLPAHVMTAGTAPTHVAGCKRTGAVQWAALPALGDALQGHTPLQLALAHRGATAGTPGDAGRACTPAAAVCPSGTCPVQCCPAAQRHWPLSVALRGWRGQHGGGPAAPADFPHSAPSTRNDHVHCTHTCSGMQADRRRAVGGTACTW